MNKRECSKRRRSQITNISQTKRIPKNKAERYEIKPSEKKQDIYQRNFTTIIPPVLKHKVTQKKNCG